MFVKLCPSCEDEFYGNNYLSNRYAVQRNWCVPAVNISESSAGFRVEVAAPGYEKSDFKVDVDKNQLFVSSEKDAAPATSQQGKSLRKEFCYQAFKRSFLLPENVDTDKISASYDKGILTVTVPKKEKANISKQVSIS